ncbi:hypothetical protein Bca52824_002287 [Brassica carinata]|uniref:F-box domain-containing protein n=1 Tax=Brassica carinata TaxID=52824 RepID=A0A8X8BEQ7_BRACI|nr:hypothetical protein Bca52824_002287 [Brassica carinata]
MAPSLFSSLHKDIAWRILARVPKRSYPVLACVSKNLRSLVRSPEIHKIRSLLRKDSLYICFMHKTNGVHTPHWFTLRRSTENSNHFVSVVDLAFPDPNEPMPSIIACGPEIFFISGSFVPSSTVWIFDSRTGEFRQGPSMNEEHLFKSVGLVGSKIYVVEGYVNDEIHHQAESFDVKTQTWERAPSPELEGSFLATANVSLDRKVCKLMAAGDVAVFYDTRDGSCEVFDLPKDKWWRTGVCVMDNVMYVYYARFGLMWYDTGVKLWRVVNRLDGLKKVRGVAMAEYYGKMAFLWREYGVVGGAMKEVWCRMIALERSEEGISGTAESGQLMGSVPRGFRLQHCLSVSE